MSSTCCADSGLRTEPRRPSAPRSSVSWTLGRDAALAERRRVAIRYVTTNVPPWGVVSPAPSHRAGVTIAVAPSWWRLPRTLIVDAGSPGSFIAMVMAAFLLGHL